jgi:organic hydroperoxide reductase OsmC/OhrA
VPDKQHRYTVTVEWTGNRGEGTASYRSYDRDHEVRAENLPPILGSSDRYFRGNPSRWNPEQLLVVAASQCHMLSYLHHAAVNDVVVTGYVDHPTAVMTEDGNGGGQFTEIVLHPLVTVADASMIETAERLHHDANRSCFIASSLNLPVQHDARTAVQTVR